MAEERVTDDGEVRLADDGETRVVGLLQPGGIISPAISRQIAYAESSGDGEMSLIVIDHGDLDEPMRFARNGLDVVHDGETYVAFDFNISAPHLQTDGSFVQAKLEIAAVDRRMVEALRSITTPATLQHTLVLISDPDVILHGPWSYQIRGEQTYDAFSMELQLTFAPVLEEQCPWKRLSPSRAPGLF